jgi:hypothetical protein
MSRRFSFLFFSFLFVWFPLAHLPFAHRATQMAWACDPISRCIHMNSEGIVLLEMHILGVLDRLLE